MLARCFIKRVWLNLVEVTFCAILLVTWLHVIQSSVEMVVSCASLIQTAVHLCFVSYVVVLLGIYCTYKSSKHVKDDQRVLCKIIKFSENSISKIYYETHRKLRMNLSPELLVSNGTLN